VGVDPPLGSIISSLRTLIASIIRTLDVVAHLQVVKRKRGASAAELPARLGVVEADEGEMRQLISECGAGVPSGKASACHLFSSEDRSSIIDLRNGRKSRS
jgi:hypothetical protein